MIEKQEATDANTRDSQELRDLIRHAKHRYQPAFTELIALHQKAIFKLAYGFFHDKDDAMEIVQETFIRLYQKIDGFDETDERTRFHHWLNRMAYNICIDYYRKFKKQKVSMKEIYDFDETTRPSSIPEEEIDRDRFRNYLKNSVQGLPQRQQMVFVLKHFNGLKHHEISNMLNLSVGTIKSIYHRAIQNLKKKLVGAH